MLRQLQALALIVGFDVRTVELFRTRDEALINEARHKLSVFEYERRIVTAHFQRRTRTAAVAFRRVAEAAYA